MKGNSVGLIGLVTCVVAIAPAHAQPRSGRGAEQEAGRQGWLSNLEEAKGLARQTGKPIMAVVRCVP